MPVARYPIILLAMFASVHCGGVLFSQESVAAQRQVEGTNLIITWSETNDELRGFSKQRVEWETLKIERQEKIVPQATGNVAVVRIGDSIAAFSADKGWWDVISLTKGSTAEPALGPDLVQFQDGGHRYTFAAAKGRWTSPTDPELRTAQLEIQFRSSPIDMTGYLNWLKTQPGYKARGIQVTKLSDGQATLQTDRQSWLNEAELKLRTSIMQPEPSLESRLASLRAELSSVELKVQAASGHDGNLKEAKQPDAEQKLREMVEQAFELRQQLQRLEAQRMRLKLQTIEANLDSREKNRDRIVQRRVEELLDPNVTATGWNLPVQGTPSGNYGMPTTGTPIGLPGPPMLPGADGSNFDAGGLQSHQVQNINSPVKWKEPNEVVSELRMYRGMLESRIRVRARDTERIATFSRPLDQFTEVQYKGITEEDKAREIDHAKLRLSENEKHLTEQLADWNRAWSSYQTQLRMLKLDVEAAKLALEPVQQNHERLEKFRGSGEVTLNEVERAAAESAIAQVQVQRAEELLRLYEEVEKVEPQLNPEAFIK